MITHEREKEKAEADASLRDMKDFLSQDKCASRYFKKAYGLKTQKVCGGCQFCRTESRPAGDCPPLDFDESENYISQYGFLSDFPDPFSDQGLLDFKRFFNKLGNAGKLNRTRFICERDCFDKLMSVLEKCEINSKQAYRFDYVDDGKIIVMQDEVVLCLHFNTISSRILDFNQGSKIIHCVVGQFKYLDDSGRYPKEGENAKNYSNLDQLIEEI